MAESKLYKMYSVLKAKEKKKFSEWLKTDLESRQQELLVLLDCLPKKMTKQKIWKKMFLHKEFDDAKFRTYAKRLTKHIEEYLAFIYLRKNPNELNLALLGELSNRKKPELYKQELDKADNRLGVGKVRDEKFYLLRYQLNVKYQEYANHHNPKSATERTKKVNESFDLWWALMKLKLGIVNNSYLKRGAIIKTEFIEPLFEKISQTNEENSLIDGNLFQNNIPIQIYYLTNKLQTELKLEIAEELLRLLKKAKPLLSDTSYRIVYSMIINFYIDKVNSEGGKYFQKLSDLYISGFEEKILYINKFINFQHLANLITVAINLSKFKEAKRYLNTYTDKLPRLDRKDVMRVGMARIHFEKGEFEEAKNLLSQKKKRIRQELLRIQAKVLTFKCDYELLDGDLTDDDVQKIIRLTNRHEKISKNLKQLLRNSFPYMKKLVTAYREEDFENLRDELEKESRILEKKWMLEKIDQRLK